MALREDLDQYETEEAPYVDATSWGDVRQSALEDVERAAMSLVTRVSDLLRQNTELEAALRQSRQREQKLMQENKQMRSDIAFALERVERALDALLTGG